MASHNFDTTPDGGPLGALLRSQAELKKRRDAAAATGKPTTALDIQMSENQKLIDAHSGPACPTALDAAVLDDIRNQIRHEIAVMDAALTAAQNAIFDFGASRESLIRIYRQIPAQ